MTEAGPRSYDPKFAALLVANLGEATRVGKNLSTSIQRTAHLFPLDGMSLEAMNDDGKEHSNERAEALNLAVEGARHLLAVLDGVGK